MSSRPESTARCALIAAEEGRCRSMAPRGGSGCPPPPAVVKSLGVWPPSQSTRDSTVRIIVQHLVGPSPFSHRYGAVPEPKAKRVAAAVEAEAFAAASESVAGATLASDLERYEVFRRYSREYGLRLLEFARRGVQEPGDSSAMALPPAAASDAGDSRRLLHHLPLLPRSRASRELLFF